MTTTHREIERKYEATKGTALPSWASLLGGQEPRAEEQVLLATYLDTPDLRLAGARITLRYRIGDEAKGWHLKLPAGKDTRDELQYPPQPGDDTEPAGGPPPELVELIRSFTGGEALTPVVRLRTARRLLRWTDPAGGNLLDVTDDRVTATALPAGAETSWREIEVELGADGDLALLKRADHLLRAAGVRRSESSSKLARALGDRAPVPPRTPAGRKARAGEVPLAYLRTQVAAIRRYDVEVRRDSEDAVHQLRVATRRARSALQVYGDLIERDRTRDLTDELKWIAGVAGESRDLEVLRARFTAAAAAQQPENVLGPVRAQIVEFFAPRQAAARTRLLEALDGERYAALLASLDTLVSEPPWTSRARKPATTVVADTLAHAHKRIRRHLDAAAAGAGDAEFHEARKAAKRLRYAAEAAEPVLGKRARAVVDRTKVLQEVLGEHQDAVVALPVLRELGAAAHASGGNGYTFGLLAGHEAATGIDEPAVLAVAAKLAKAVKAAR